MASRIAAQWENIAFSAMILRSIMDNPMDEETAQSRLKQIGMMSILYHMHIGQVPITLTNIMGETGLTRSGVAETVDQLVQRQILMETIERNTLGRGTARRFHIAPKLFDGLMA
jgi:DNA-binding MarR family transcriptional regulator